MKAAYIETTGSPDVIRYGDLPTPTPKQGEVLVRVGAVAVNPIDLYIRAGTVADAAAEAVHPRLRPGRHGRGGRPWSDSASRPGDRVWGSNQGLLGRQGTFAEYAAVGEDWLYPTPAGVTDMHGRGGALVGITAHLGLFRCAKLQAGETVFVNGGTGGVGSMVVQMAKAVGAKVITTVGSPEKAALCRTWGADASSTTRRDDVRAGVRGFTRARASHVWYETQREPDFVRTVDLMAQRGRMVVIAGRQAQPVFPVGPFYVKGLSLYRLRHVQRHAGGAAPLRRRHQPLAGGGQAAAAHRPDVPAGGDGGGAPLPGGKHAAKGGHLIGKVVLTP